MSTTALPHGDASGSKWTRFGVWLMKLGIEVIHSRPYHPQGRGKNERFHRTLDQEVFAFGRFADQAAVQRAFDRWRDVYNFERPHEGIACQAPADRYRPSARSMPKTTPQAEYEEREIVRSVPATKDYVSFSGRFGKSRWLSAANASPSVQNTRTASSASSSARAKSQRST